MYVLQLDAEETRLNEFDDNNVAKFNLPEWQNNPNTICFRCSQPGHKIRSCPLNETKEDYCYVCCEITDHEGNSCSNRSGRIEKY